MSPPTSAESTAKSEGGIGLLALPQFSLQMLLVEIPGVLVAIVLHEFAHAAVATALGDPTPRLQGRLSLDPLRHIDWIGAIFFLLAGFGWAKPVQIDPRYYRNPRAGMVLVALAGPVMNMLVALVCLFVLVHVAFPTSGVGRVVGEMVSTAVELNVFFGVFNILPIPPLDGSRILSAISREGMRLMTAVEPYGWILLLVLLVFGVLGRVLQPMADVVLRVLEAIVGA